MKTKFTKHRQILTSNWQQAEDEVRKVDDIYHSTIDKVISTVESLPETLSGDPALAALVTTLRQEQMEADTVVKTAENLANGNAVTAEDNKSSTTAALISDGINGNQGLSNGNGNNGLSPPPLITGNLKSKSDLLLSLSCRENKGGKGKTGDSTTSTTNSNGGMMSQSMLIESCHSSNRNNSIGGGFAGSNGSIEVGGIRLKSGVLSEPCLQKAPLLGGLPTTTLLTSPERLKQQEDLNANQSL